MSSVLNFVILSTWSSFACQDRQGEGWRRSSTLPRLVVVHRNTKTTRTFWRGVGLVYGISELATAEVYCGVSLSTVRLCVPNMCLISSKHKRRVVLSESELSVKLSKESRRARARRAQRPTRAPRALAHGHRAHGHRAHTHASPCETQTASRTKSARRVCRLECQKTPGPHPQSVLRPLSIEHCTVL